MQVWSLHTRKPFFKGATEIFFKGATEIYLYCKCELKGASVHHGHPANAIGIRDGTCYFISVSSLFKIASTRHDTGDDTIRAGFLGKIQKGSSQRIGKNRSSLHRRTEICNTRTTRHTDASPYRFVEYQTWFSTTKEIVQPCDERIDRFQNYIVVLSWLGGRLSSLESRRYVSFLLTHMRSTNFSSSRSVGRFCRKPWARLK